MLAGDFEHKDSTGGQGRMTAGDVQWMKTGSGIIHSEMPAMKEGRLHGFQLWINMPAKLKMSKPEYIYIDSKEMQIHKDLDKTVKTIAGKFEKAEGPIKGHNVEPIYFDIELNKDKPLSFSQKILTSGLKQIDSEINHIFKYVNSDSTPEFYKFILKGRLRELITAKSFLIF